MSQSNRVSTTVIAIAVLALGGIGFFRSSAFVPQLLLEVRLGPAEASMWFLLCDTLLSVVSKMALITVGISLLVRAYRIVLITASALAVSVLDTAFLFAFIVIPQKRYLGEADPGLMIAGLVHLTVSLIIYGSVLLYITRPASRSEFGHSS